MKSFMLNVSYYIKIGLIIGIIFTSNSLTTLAEENLMGIGVKLQQKNEKIYIVKPEQDSPASDAGLQQDDEIVEINGETIKNLTLDEVVNRIKGEKDTKVKLKIITKDNEIKNIEITRNFDVYIAQIKNNLLVLLENKKYTEILILSNEYLKDKNVLSNKTLLTTIYDYRGIARYNLDDNLAGFEEFNKAADIIPHSYAFYGMGNCALGAKQYDIALKFYILSIDYNKDNPEAFEGKAYACLGLKNYKEYFKNLEYAKEQYLRHGNTVKYKQMLERLKNEGY